MLRFLMRYLANNEKLVTKLAESRLMRRAAQFVVHILARSNSISGTQLPNNSREFVAHLSSLARKYANDLKDGINSVKDEIKKK